MNINRKTQGEVAKLAIELYPQKDALQKRINEGATLASFAQKHKLAAKTMRDIMTGLGIMFPERTAKVPYAGRLDNLEARVKALEDFITK